MCIHISKTKSKLAILLSKEFNAFWRCDEIYENDILFLYPMIHKGLYGHNSCLTCKNECTFQKASVEILYLWPAWDPSIKHVALQYQEAILHNTAIVKKVYKNSLQYSTES